MNSLHLLVGYGSGESDDSDNDENDGTIPQNLQTNKQSEQRSFFEAQDESSSTDEDEKEPSRTSKGATNPASLKNPFRFSDGGTASSVFANPFKEAEEAEKCTLEKHVKFAPKIEDVKEINGRKICWNYRKGRCRFGNNCVFAHDCELLQKKAEPDPSQFTISSPDFENPTDLTRPTNSNKKRPGLSQGIVPGKKVMKKYYQQQASEKPWNVQK